MIYVGNLFENKNHTSIKLCDSLTLVSGKVFLCRDLLAAKKWAEEAQNEKKTINGPVKTGRKIVIHNKWAGHWKNTGLRASFDWVEAGESSRLEDETRWTGTGTAPSSSAGLARMFLRWLEAGRIAYGPSRCGLVKAG